MPNPTFKIDVSRLYRNKTGYDNGYKLNTSFKTETHTVKTFVDTVVEEGWPYTMVHQKRSPQETGADARGVKTPKHIENFISMQLLTADDDSGEEGVIDFWLNDQFFSQYGLMFVESVNSKPEKQKGHPTLLFDKPITDPRLYKECLQAFCFAYPRADWLINIDRTIYNAVGAKIHKVAKICPFAVFERKILNPWRKAEAEKQAAIEAEKKRREVEWEQQKAQGKTVSSNLEEAWLSGYLNWLFDKVATTPKGQNRNMALFWAGRSIAGVQDTGWCKPHLHLLNDVNSRIVNACSANGYLDDYAHGQEREVLRIFERGRAAGGTALEEPKPTRTAATERKPVSNLNNILVRLQSLRDEQSAAWARGEIQEGLEDQTKEVFRDTGHLDSEEIKIVLDEAERKPNPLAKCRGDLRKIWTAARKFAQAGGVFIVRPERPATWPYDVKDGRIVYLKEQVFFDTITIQSLPVADFTAKITAEITDESGDKTFTISGNAIRGGSFKFEMDAEDFGNDRKLKAMLDAYSGARDPVRARMSGHLSPALQLLTDSNVEQFKRYKRTGWANGFFLIPGRERDNILIDPGDKPPYMIDGKADLQTGLNALDALLDCAVTPERATVAASLVFQAPMARLAKWENERYCIFITGRTGSLKTTFLQALLCIYGPRFADDEKLTKWGEGATANALMSMATSSNDLPFLIDNFKPGTGGGVRAFIGLIHNMMEGGEKDRLNRNAELRHTKPVFCWPICTGEDVPDTDPASLARILIVPFIWQDKDEYPNLSKAQELTDHLCAVGNAWLEWLESNEGIERSAEYGAKMPEYRRKWVRRLGKLRPDSVNKIRVASNLATNQLTWEILCEHPTIGVLAKRYRDMHQTGLEIVAEAMAEATAESLEATRYLAAVRELILTEQIILPDPHKELLSGEREKIIGYRDSEGIYILPALTRQAVERLLGDRLNGISQNALNKQFDTLGLVESHNKGTLLKTKRIGIDTIRVLHLKKDALEVEEEEVPF